VITSNGGKQSFYCTERSNFIGFVRGDASVSNELDCWIYPSQSTSVDVEILTRFR